MKYITIFHGFRNKKKKMLHETGLLRIQAPQSPIQVLTAITVARKKANHSTSVGIKAGFHNDAVEVIIYLIRYKKKKNKIKYIKKINKLKSPFHPLTETIFGKQNRS